ncbi:MAG TPA: prolipoprotein diacylglyceryl transferase [Candidatus Acidoferrales bacterium]|nr:prolipoprotein diacylglyceryl transferase [Candidatus Acidoferrales bacterium]
MYTSKFDSMMPFLHIGPFTLASFGLLVGIAMFVSYYVLARDVVRRGIRAPADLLVAVPCIAGLIGAKLYHVFEDPRLLFANPRELISQYGFAWFGGLIGGLAAFIWLAHHYRVPLLEIFDAASPAAALGYGIGRIGCLVSGDGDYGKPTSLPWGMSFPHGLVPTTQRVHPTPIYELIVAIFIFWYLWKLGGRQIRAFAERSAANAKKSAAKMNAKLSEKNAAAKNISASEPSGSGGVLKFLPHGEIFAHYLILTGLARFLVEFIRINPRHFFGLNSAWFPGLSNAQAASLASIVLGAALLWRLPRSSASAK